MQKRQLGKNGPWVSALGLGCMGMSQGYGVADDTESMHVIQEAIDLGVTLLDTADMYGWGHNETLIGKVLKGQRDKVCLATKVGFVQTQDNVVINTSPAYIKSSCDASLKRLGVDEIDLYYLHRINKETPIEDSMLALADLVQSGKIRHIGLSEVKPDTIRRAALIHPITAVETEYSLWQRTPEEAILPVCRELGIGFVPYSPLGRGFLTGTVQQSNQYEAKDFRWILPRFQGENFEKNKILLKKLTEIAVNKQCSIAQLALAWLLKQGNDIVPIPGTKKIKYVRENIASLNIVLSADDLTTLNHLFPIGIAAGEKYPPQFDLEN